MQRRRAIWAAGFAAVLASIASLAGCGFHLREAPRLQFQTIELAGFAARSPLAADLRQGIDGTPTTHVVDALPQAQVVLDALIDKREVVVVASTASGQVTELQLRSRFGFRLRTPTGRELIAPTEILLSRDLSYTESAALAKEQEQEVLYRAMQSDIVTQVLRRLAAVTP